MRHALPLMLLLALATTGCFGQGPGSAAAKHSGAAGQVRLTVRLLPGECSLGVRSQACIDATPTIRRATLTCDPAAGTWPHPATACRALADFARHQDHLGGCIGELLSPGSTAKLSGTYAGRFFHLQLAAGWSWCGQQPSVLRDFWILSTFPCSTRVLHQDSRFGANGNAWNRATGCVAGQA